jgi:hypothetical protein
LVDLWPDESDLKRTLFKERSHNNGLYTGEYEPGLLLRGITRHCLYSDAILLVDPFTYPTSVRDEFNPILNPDKFINTTIQWVRLWFALAPWIDAGLVKFVRTPGDFDPMIMWKCLTTSEEKMERYPELKTMLESETKKKVAEDKVLKKFYFLSQPDSYIVNTIKEMQPDISEDQLKTFMNYVKRQRDEHPFLGVYADGKSRMEQILVHSTGTNYEMAKRIAEISESYLITDMPTRWKEIELDRAEANIDHGKWSPFAKAFQEAKWKHLENVDLPSALRLRKEDRLQDMRHFLRKVWMTSMKSECFDRANAENLAAELNERANEAEFEWGKIDQELLKYFGGTTVASLIAAGPAIATGNGSFMAAAYAAAGATEIALSTYKRAKFPKKYPAGFFLGH